MLLFMRAIIIVEGFLDSSVEYFADLRHITTVTCKEHR